MSVGGDGSNPWDWGTRGPAPEPETHLLATDPDGVEWYPPRDASANPEWYSVPQSDQAATAPYGSFGGNLLPSRKRWRVPVAIAVAAAVALVAVAVALVLPGGTKSAQAMVMDSVNHAVASKTAHATMTMNLNSGRVTGTGTGVLDFVNGSMDMSMDMSSVEPGLTIRIVYVAGKMYEQIPQISQLYPGKSWLSLDLSGIAKASGGTGALNLGGNPTAMLRLLTQEGATVTPVGSSDIDGVPVKGYVVNIDPAFLKKQLGSANLPSWMRQAVSMVNFQGATETVFIDSSGSLRRDAMHMAMSLSSHQPSMTIDESLDLSDYGAPVSITAPPADQVIDMQQFLNQATTQST